MWSSEQVGVSKGSKGYSGAYLTFSVSLDRPRCHSQCQVNKKSVSKQKGRYVLLYDVLYCKTFQCGKRIQVDESGQSNMSSTMTLVLSFAEAI